jgi:hypothetical protein
MANTPAVCYPVVRGRVARFTRVDNCGCPTPGPCSSMVTEDIVTVTISPEVEEGEEITVRNMAGKLCISDKPCDSIKWFNVEITMCKQIPALYSLIAGYTTAHNFSGQVVGFGISSDIDCSGGFAFEIWGETPGVVCVPGASAGQWDYLIIPWVSAATLSGDIEIGNSARQPVLTGRSKTGHCWGSGPYDVQVIDGIGTCGPLIEPIPPDMHLWDLLVSCPPPTPACECIESFIFCQASLSLVDNVGEPSTDGICARVRWNAVGAVTIKYHAADAATPAAATGDGIHCYSGAQAVGGVDNVITIALVSDPTKTCTKTYRIPPDATIIEGATDMEASVTVVNSGKDVTIDWGDGTAVSPNTGDGVEIDTHTYALAGTYTITVCNVDIPTICSVYTQVIPF